VPGFAARVRDARPWNHNIRSWPVVLDAAPTRASGCSTSAAARGSFPPRCRPGGPP